MQGFTTIDLIILIVYLAAVLFAGLFFSKKEMKGKEFFKGRRHHSVVGYLRFHIRNIIKSHFLPVPGRKFLCRNMDYVVRTVRNACGHTHYH